MYFSNKADKIQWASGDLTDYEIKIPDNRKEVLTH